MIVVGLETSSATAGIAVIRDRQVLADTTLEVGAVYAEQLPGILERTMGDLDLQWREVEGYAISIGPGSYTGLRVGLSLVKGLSYVTKRPVAAVPTLDAVAFQVPCCRYPVHVFTDARRGQVYEARYDTGDGCPRRTTEFRVGLLEDVLESIEDTVLLVGSGVEAYRPGIVSALGDRARFAPPGTGRLMASSTAFLGLDLLRQGGQANLHELEPLYLRKTEFARQPPSRLNRTPSGDHGPSSQSTSAAESSPGPAGRNRPSAD